VANINTAVIYRSILTQELVGLKLPWQFTIVLFKTLAPDLIVSTIILL